MTARSVPERPARCQRSLAAMSLGRCAMWPGEVVPAAACRVAQPLPDLGVLALVGGDRVDLGRCLRGVGVLLVALQRLDQVADGVRPEQPGDEHDGADAQSRAARLGHGRAELAQLAGPDLGVASLVAGDRPERLGAARVLLDARQRVVQRDRVALELEVLEALGDVDRGHRRRIVAIRGRVARPAASRLQSPRCRVARRDRGRCRRSAGSAPPTSPRRCRRSRSGSGSPSGR